MTNVVAPATLQIGSHEMVSLNSNRRTWSETVRLSAGATGRTTVISVGWVVGRGSVDFASEIVATLVVVVHHRGWEKLCTAITKCCFVVFVTLNSEPKERIYREYISKRWSIFNCQGSRPCSLHADACFCLPGTHGQCRVRHFPPRPNQNWTIQSAPMASVFS